MRAMCGWRDSVCRSLRRKVRAPLFFLGRHSDNPAAYTHEELRPHIISTGNDGELREQGMFGTTPESLREIFDHYIPTITSNGKQNASCSSRTAVSLTSNRLFSTCRSCANLCSRSKSIPSPLSGRLITGRRCKIFCVTHFRAARPVACSMPRKISCSTARMICSSRLRERSPEKANGPR